MKYMKYMKYSVIKPVQDSYSPKISCGLGMTESSYKWFTHALQLLRRSRTYRNNTFELIRDENNCLYVVSLNVSLFP